MKRSYYRRGRLVEVEQVDGVLAVQGSPAATRSRRSFGKSARPDIRAAAPEIDEDALDAFAAADWQLVSPNASTRRAMNRGSTPQAADGVGTVVVGEGGRVGIASDLLNVQLTADLSSDEAERVLEDAGLTVVTQLRFAPNLYEVRTRRGDALDASMALNDNPQFVFAEPSLVEHIPQRFTPPTPATTTSGSGTTPVPAAARSGPTCTSNRPGTTPSAPASGSPSSTTVSTPTTRTWPPVSARVGLLRRRVGRRGCDHHRRHGRDARQRPRHLLRRMVGARSGNGGGGVGAAPECELMLIACLGDQVGTQTTLARAVRLRRGPGDRGPAPPDDGRRHHGLQPRPQRRGLGPDHHPGIGHRSRGRQRPRGRGWRSSGPPATAATSTSWRTRSSPTPTSIAVVRSNRKDLEDNAARGAEVELIAPGVDVVSTRVRRRLRRQHRHQLRRAVCGRLCRTGAVGQPDLTRDELRAIMHDHRGPDRRGRLRRQWSQRRLRLRPGERLRRGLGRRPANPARHLRSGVHRRAGGGDRRAVDHLGCVGIEDLTFEVTSGPTSTAGSANSFELLVPSITVPAPGVGVTVQAQIRLTYTGTSAGDTATGVVEVAHVLTGETWSIPLSANTVSRPITAAAVAGGDRS